jgi:hypothetical protein
MSEPQSPQPPKYGNPTPQNPTGSDPYGGKKPPNDPCDDPKPPDDPTYPADKPPCPPPEDPCPPPKPCPEPPKPPCPPPDPCPPDDKPPYDKPGDKPKEPYGSEDPGDPSKPADYPTTPQKPGGYGDKPGRPGGYEPKSGGDEPKPGDYEGTPGKPGEYKGKDDPGSGGKPQDNGKKPCGDKGPGSGGAAAGGPAAHLVALKARLEAEQKELQRFEPLKTSIADLTQRIATLEKAVEGQAAASTAYKEFYRTTEVQLHELRCSIPTIRCQLDQLTDKHKTCICEAIDAVDTRVAKAKQDSAEAAAAVTDLETKVVKATRNLEWAKKLYDFLKSGLQQQVTKQVDDLKALKQLANPAKDQCEVWFYLLEMERLMKSWRADDDAKGEVCWKTDLSVGTFLDCWGPDCYEKHWHWIVVEFNTAEADEKLLKSQLEQAKKRAADLDKIAKEAESKRREWILKEIKAKDCCGPTSRCP